jgi:hypothetical protein
MESSKRATNRGTGGPCARSALIVGSRRQTWGDIALMVVAIVLPALLAAAVRKQWPAPWSGGLFAASVAAVAWLFTRQLVRGERGWMFYSAMIVFSSVSQRPESLTKAGIAGYWLAALAVVASMPAVAGIVGAVRIVRSLDEMWRQINYRALAFAFIATLVVVLGTWVLASAGVEVLTWRRLLLLMGVLWGGALGWEYWRFR